MTYKEVPYEKKYYLDLNYYKLFPNPKRDKKRDFKDFVYYDFFNLKWKNRKQAYTTVISYLYGSWLGLQIAMTSIRHRKFQIRVCKCHCRL